MNAEIFTIAQQSQDCIRHRTDARLNYRAVFEIFRSVASNRLVGCANFGRRNLHRRTRYLHRDIDLGRWHRLAISERHLIVDFGNYDARPTDRGLHVVADESAAMIAILISRADLHERDIATYDAGFNHRTNLTDMTRNHTQLVGFRH